MGAKPHKSEWISEIETQLVKHGKKVTKVDHHNDEGDLTTHLTAEIAAFRRANGYRMEAWSIPPKGKGKKKCVYSYRLT